MHLITKNIPTKYLVLDNGQEVNLNHFLKTIEDFVEADLDDMGEYGLRNYEVSYVDLADILVEMNLLKMVNGPRMANIYAVADRAKLCLLYGDILELVS